VSFNPDYLGDLPVWGIDWQNPPFSRDLLKELVRFQDQMDDHGTDEWPLGEWELWVEEGKRLAQLVQRELGPSVELEISWEFQEHEPDSPGN
jgi:hypothetical protein